MSSGPPPPPPRPGGAAAAGRAGAPHPTSMFSKRPPGGPGTSRPFAASNTDPAARRANMLSVYSQYANPMAGNAGTATPSPPTSTMPAEAVASLPPPPRSMPAGSTVGPHRGYPVPPPPPPPGARPALATATSSSSLPPPSKSALPKMAPLSDPSDASPPPPPPPPSRPVTGQPITAAGGGSRYAVPDFVFDETPDRAHIKEARGSARPAEDGAVMPPPSSATNTTAPPTASRAALHTQTPPTVQSRPVFHSTVQHYSGPEPPAFASSPPLGSSTVTQAPPSLPPQPPAPASAPPPTSTNAAAPPLMTRVSGAVLRGTASSRASSNGGGSRSSSHHSQRGGRGSLDASDHAALKSSSLVEAVKSTSSLFACPPARTDSGEGQTVGTATTATSPATLGYKSSQPTSRSSSLNAHGASAAALAAVGGGRRPSSSAAGRSPNVAAAASNLHRDVPSFLKPSGGASGHLPSQRSRAAAAVASGGAAASNTHAPASRGRELLEAALKSRGNRAATAYSSRDTSQPVLTAENSLSSLQGKEPVRSEATTAEREALAKTQPSAVADARGNNANSHQGTELEDVEAHGVHRRSSTGDFLSDSRSYRAVDSSNRPSPVMRVPPLQRGRGTGEDAASGLTAAGGSLQEKSQNPFYGRPQTGHENKGGMSSSDVAPFELIAGEVNASTTEVRDITSRHTPRSGAMEPLPTPTEEDSQRSTAASPHLLTQRDTTATTPLTRQANNSGHLLAAAAAAGGNPFLEFEGVEAEPVFSPDSLHAQSQPLPLQPPALPHHPQYNGVPDVPRPHDAVAPSIAVNPFATGSEKRRESGLANVSLAPPPLPPRQLQQHQPQQQPPVEPAAPPPPPPLPQHRVLADAPTANGNSGFTTPRAGGGRGGAPAAGGSMHENQQRTSQPTAGMPPSTSSVGAMRGPYAASPFNRDEDGARAMDDESPLPLRPPAFDSVPQPEADELYETGQEAAEVVEGDEFGAHSLQQHGGKGANVGEKQGHEPEDGSTPATDVARPFTWENDGASLGYDDDDGSFLGANDDERAPARRQTQQPREFNEGTAPAAPASQHSPNAPPLPSLPPPPPHSAPPPPPPPPSNVNRSVTNPFQSRRPDARAERADDLRRQHQEQLQARVQAAQQSSVASLASPAPAASTRGPLGGSPIREEPSRHFNESFFQQSSPFTDSRLGSANNLAQSSSFSAPPPPPQAQHQARQQKADPAHSSPVDVRKDGGLSRPSFASGSNPFLDTGDDAPVGQGSQMAAAENYGALALKSHHGATSSLSSLPPHQMSPNNFATSLEPCGANAHSRPGQPLSVSSSVAGAPALSLTEEDLNALGNASSNNNFLSASGTLGLGASAATKTPGGSALVNPFSKAARGSAASAAADVCGPSAGASLTSSFASRRKTRRLGAPCFAIFVGGGVTGVPSSEANKGVSCIAACFNNPRVSSSPTAGGAASRTRSPSAQAAPGSGPVSHASSFKSPPPNAAATRGTTAATAPRSANGSGDVASNNSTNGNAASIGICLSFCSVMEALTAKGSVVDRKGIRGTESGRRYARALRDAVLPCALAANAWAATGPKWSEMADALAALETCVPAPLTSVLAMILKDAMAAETQEGFAWKDNGGRRLGELLLQAAHADARRHATTATSGQGNTALASALNASPLNVAAEGGAIVDTKEKSAMLSKVEDLLCTGQRVEAVEVALEARLYVHALLISMMCPTKDEYLRTVRAVTQGELLWHSPLSHAYSMFNELPQPPLLPPPSASSTKAKDEGEGEGIGEQGEDSMAMAQDKRRQRDVEVLEQATLKGTWRRHAAVLLANFTRHSGEGLLTLAGNLQRLHLVVEAHTCLLLLHLTPLGMAGPVRAGAEPLPPASTMSAEDIEDLLPRPDQQQVMEEIRRRMGVVGGMYHPTQGCRAGFLTPVTTLLTQLLNVAQEQLNARATPLPVPGMAGALVPFHGLPGVPSRTDVGYRMMQVLWLREAGLVRESKQALTALLQRMSPPAAFSLHAPPRTLNELVYLFGGVPPPPSQGNERLEQKSPSQTLQQELSLTAESISLPPDDTTPESMSGTQQPSTNGSAALAPHSLLEEHLGSGEGARRGGSSGQGAIESRQTSLDTQQALPPPPPSQPPTSSKPPPPPPPQQKPSPAATGLTPGQRAAALQPPARPAALQNAQAPPLQPPPPQQQQQQQPKGDSSLPSPPPTETRTSDKKPAPKPTTKPASRRSRSMEALRNLFFRRGASESNEAEKPPAAEEAKPMHLDTEKPPEFDPVTGRWLFPETEEEKKLRELTKQGPPKMAPKTVENTPASAPSASGTPNPPQMAPSAVKQPAGPPSVVAAAPTHGAPAPTFAPRRGAPPPMMAGRGGGGARRPGGRQQYVDMFNSTN